MDKIRAKLESKALPSALLTVFLDAIGVAILIPVYAALVLPGKFQIIPADWTIQQGYIMVGWLTGIYSLMTFLAAPVLGQLSDKYGRKPILGVSLLGTALGYALFAVGIITKNIPLLFLSRSIDGITGGNIAVARAVISDVSAPEHRTRNFGLIGAMFGIGFVLGPYLGGRLSSAGVPFINAFGIHALTTPHWFSPAVPFWFATIVAFLNAMLVFFTLPETLKEKIHARLRWTQSFRNIRAGLRMPRVKTLLPVNFLFSAGFTFFTTFFGFSMIKRIPGFTPANVADYFSLIGIWIAVFQAILIPMLAKRFKNYQVLRVSMFGVALSLPAVLWAHTTEQAILVSPLIPLFVAMTMANSIALLSSVADSRQQGEVMGVNSSFEALAQGIPAVLSGYIASIAVGLPTLVGSTLVALAGIMFILTFKAKMVQHKPVMESAELEEEIGEVAPIH
jgi:DHA1 family tetracycline resistance protein-like MFS transporter